MERKLKEFSDKCVQFVMDSLEGCINSITLAAGRRMLKVWMVSFCILILSVILRILKIFSFISWQEALTCLILSTIICLVDKSNQYAILILKKQIRRKGRNE